MPCGSCAQRAAAAAQYPRKVRMPDGTFVEVTSAEDERAQRRQISTKMAEQRQGRGYVARQR